MKALRVHGFDGLHQWRWEDLADPVPLPHEVIVQVEATAISYVDLLFARGGYQMRSGLPFVPGTEFSGIVLDCGPAVAGDIRPGRRVAGTVLGGAWAQRVRVDANAVQLLPDGVDPRPASALAVTFATAHYALTSRTQLRSGENVLILGATGGVGLACIQVARALGARVVAGVSGSAKMRLAHEIGAECAVDTSQSDWRVALQQLAPEGIDVVVDSVGGSLTETAFRCLRWGGRHLVVGFADGAIPSLRLNLPLLKGASLIGVDIRQFREREPEAARANLAAVVGLFASGALAPRIAQVYPALEWEVAMRQAADRSTVGRVVLDWT
jgi:NADPH2:quinone reductase